MWNAISLVQDFKLMSPCPFPTTITITSRAPPCYNLTVLRSRHQLYGHLPPITKTIQVRRARHAWHRWRSKDELVSDVLLWTPTYGQAKAGRPARTYIQQLCEDTGCNPEDLPEVMNDREKWREMVKDIRAGGTSWWWWWWSLFQMYVLKKGRMLTKRNSTDSHLIKKTCFTKLACTSVLNT